MKRSRIIKTISDLITNNILTVIIISSVIYIAIRNPHFLTARSVINVISLSAASLPAALGVGGCIVLKGTDLSAGRTIGLAACISASLLQIPGLSSKMWPQIAALPIPLVLLAAMAIGAGIGAFNGFFISKFKLHPFIVTLSTQLIVYSVLLLYVRMGNNHGAAIAGLDPSYTEFVRGSVISIGDIPIPNFIWLSAALALIVWFIWNKTVFGKSMFAVGSNIEAAKISGVNVLGETVGVFALAGTLYGITGFIEGARIASNTAATGQGYELDAITACVIGGVSFTGGTGRISGIIVGVILLRLIFIGLNMVSMDQNLQYLIKGGMILLACAGDMRKHSARKSL